MMQILVLLGIYFDAVVVFITSQALLFRFALAILCEVCNKMLVLLLSDIGFVRFQHYILVTYQQLINFLFFYMLKDIHCRPLIMSQKVTTR